jgi:predicted outer membrane repeat protein
MYIHTYAGAIYLDEASMQASAVIQFINNSAAISGGALLGSPQSVVDIQSDSIVMLNNTAERVRLGSVVWLPMCL